MGHFNQMLPPDGKLLIVVVDECFAAIFKRFSIEEYSAPWTIEEQENKKIQI